MAIVHQHPTPDELRAAALAYAARGWHVLPIHTIHEGECTCGKPDCGSPGKHPITPRGCLDASSDPETVTRWWTEAPTANVGIATGTESGVFVVDLDGPAGIAAFNLLTDTNGEPPKTYAVETGGDGLHIYFRWPINRLVSNRAKLLGHPIDVRGSNGYVLAPPSHHKSGRKYRLDVDVNPAEAPTWLLDFVAPVEVSQSPPLPSANGLTLHVGGGADLPSRIRAYLAAVPPAISGQGGHPATYFVANALVHGFGLSALEALPYLAEWNRSCVPPWTEKELKHKLEDAESKGAPPPGKSRGYLLAESGAPSPSIILPTSNTITPHVPQTKLAEIPDWEPFPVDALPEPLRSVAIEGAAALGCDPAYLVLPLLATCAVSIGTTRAIAPRRTWREYPILWCVIIGRSGSGKSPAMDLALRPLHAAQKRMFDAYDIAQAQYEADLRDYEQRSKKSKEKEPIGLPPTEPERQRIVCGDTTIEALGVILAANPRGVMVARDELGAWIASHTRYKSGGGSDQPAWLEMHRGGPLVIDRRSSGTLYIPRASVSVCGTIQPGTLARAMGAAEREAGLLARLLLAMPPIQPRRWCDRELSDDTYQRYCRTVDELLALCHDDAGDPITLCLTAEAHRRYRKWWTAREPDDDDDLAAAQSKLDAYCLRFALIHHVVGMVAAGDSRVSDPIGLASIEAGIVLAEWFGREARRTYATLAETDEQRDLRRLVETIRRRGGSITSRELQRSSRRYRTAEDAQAELARLAAAGLATLTTETPEGGGHVTWRVSLAPTLTDADTRPETRPSPDPKPLTIAPTIETPTPQKHGEIERVSTLVNVNGTVSGNPHPTEPGANDRQHPGANVNAPDGPRRRIKL